MLTDSPIFKTVVTLVSKNRIIILMEVVIILMEVMIILMEVFE